MRTVGALRPVSGQCHSGHNGQDDKAWLPWVRRIGAVLVLRSFGYGPIRIGTPLRMTMCGCCGCGALVMRRICSVMSAWGQAEGGGRAPCAAAGSGGMRLDWPGFWLVKAADALTVGLSASFGVIFVPWDGGVTMRQAAARDGRTQFVNCCYGGRVGGTMRTRC